MPGGINLFAQNTGGGGSSKQNEKVNPWGGHTSPNGGMKSAKTSPFKVPNDEEVFLQREAERAKYQELKKLTKGMKIWEKPTANSRSPLKRVLDSDIRPADLNDGSVAFNFNSQQRGYISAAMNIAKSRVTFSLEPMVLPGGKTKQDMSDYIN
jgi:hypothetical protein